MEARSWKSTSNLPARLDLAEAFYLPLSPPTISAQPVFFDHLSTPSRGYIRNPRSTIQIRLSLQLSCQRSGDRVERQITMWSSRTVAMSLSLQPVGGKRSLSDAGEISRARNAAKSVNTKVRRQR